MSSFLPIFMGMKWFVVYVFVVYVFFYQTTLNMASTLLLLPLDLGKQGLCSRSSGSSVLWNIFLEIF